MALICRCHMSTISDQQQRPNLSKARHVTLFQRLRERKPGPPLRMSVGFRGDASADHRLVFKLQHAARESGRVMQWIRRPFLHYAQEPNWRVSLHHSPAAVPVRRRGRSERTSQVASPLTWKDLVLRETRESSATFGQASARHCTAAKVPKASNAGRCFAGCKAGPIRCRTRPRAEDPATRDVSELQQRPR